MFRTFLARLHRWLEADRRSGRAATVHLYAGILSCGILCILGLTGAILTFGNEIDGYLNPAFYRVPPSASHVPLDAITTTVRRRYPSFQVLGIGLPENEQSTAIVTLRRPRQRSVAVAVDPHTGTIVTDSTQLNNFVRNVRILHSSLFLGPIGEAVVYIAGVALLLLGVTGLTLWWKGKHLYPDFNGRSRIRLRTSLHSALGLYSALFVFSFSISAIRPLPPGLFIRYPARAGADTTSLHLPDEQLIQISSGQVPGARPVAIDYWDSSTALVSLRYPEDHSDGGRSQIFLDRATGRVIRSQTTREMNLAARYAALWNWELHTGTLFGPIWRIVTCLACLSISALSVTGLLVWTSRRTRRDRAVSADQARDLRL